MTPEMATLEAVSRVAHTMQVTRSAATLTPRDSASSSPKASVFSRHRSAMIGMSPTTRGTAYSARSDQVTLAIDPMSQ